MAFPAFQIFQNFPGENPRTPLIKGIHRLNPQNLSSQEQQPKAKEKKLESPPPLKQSARDLSLGYTEIEKRRRALGQDLFCVICNLAV